MIWLLVNQVQDWDWVTTLYSNWTQFQNFKFKIVIWHMYLTIWNINLTFWKKATFSKSAIPPSFSTSGTKAFYFINMPPLPLILDLSVCFGCFHLVSSNSLEKPIKYLKFLSSILEHSIIVKTRKDNRLGSGESLILKKRTF